MTLRWRYETWRKLYVREEGSFGRLPLYVRALAAELLKLCDEHGCIDLGGKPATEVIAFRLGATRGDRRLLAMHVPMLIADGYLVEVSPDTLLVRNFIDAQTSQTGRDRLRDGEATAAPRDRDGRATAAQRPSDEVPTAVQRPTHGRATETEPTIEYDEDPSRSSVPSVPGLPISPPKAPRIGPRAAHVDPHPEGARGQEHYKPPGKGRFGR